MAYPLPTEHERRALFAWLEQASSLTAWRRLYTFHQVFLDTVRNAYEEEQRNPSLEQTIATDRYTDILRSHDAFAGALDRLQKGDRRCFDFLGARGHFSEGIRFVEWWQDMYCGSTIGRNGFPPEDSKHWTAIAKAMHECLAALSDIGVVLQPRFTDVPAPIREVSDYLTQTTGSLIKWWLAQQNLPPVPIATPEVLIETKQIIPHYGIWEPVVVTSQLGALGTSRTDPSAALTGGRPLDGCLNYLCGGSAAPTIAFEEDVSRDEGRPTTWRLLWRDERYGSQPIPDNEQHYVFVRPVPGEVLFYY